MKFIRTFENHRLSNKRQEIIKEAVLHVNDIYKVKTMVDIPQSLINKYVSKVKDETGTDLKTFFGNIDIAEEIVKYINQNFIDVEKLPSNALTGEEIEETGEQETETEEVHTEEPVETETEESEEVTTETEVEETEEDEEDFEEPIESEEESESGDESGEEETEETEEGESEEDESEELPI